MDKILDEIDWKIINRLKENGRTTFEELAELVGFSSMGVKKRFDKLLKREFIKISALVNTKKIDLQAAFVLIEIESSEAMENLLKRFKECPRVVYIFKTLGAYNLFALIVAEDQATLESISMEKCSLRGGEGIRRSEFIPIGNILYDPFLPIRGNLTHKEKSIAPCNVDCQTCKRYRIECAGCPAASYYLGKL